MFNAKSLVRPSQILITQILITQITFEYLAKVHYDKSLLFSSFRRRSPQKE